jgi:hypothetical protein
MRRAMQTYHGANSGVSAYEVGPDFIIVQFISGERYRYDHHSPGRRHVEAMKKLAARNEGLATYISQHVKENYAAKIGHTANVQSRASP